MTNALWLKLSCRVCKARETPGMECSERSYPSQLCRDASHIAGPSATWAGRRLCWTFPGWHTCSNVQSTNRGIYRTSEQHIEGSADFFCQGRFARERGIRGILGSHRNAHFMAELSVDLHLECQYRQACFNPLIEKYLVSTSCAFRRTLHDSRAVRKLIGNLGYGDRHKSENYCVSY